MGQTLTTMLSNNVHIAFSVVMPVYNQAAFIRRAIASLLQQTYSLWELLGTIMNISTYLGFGFSIDSLREMFEPYYDKQTKSYRIDDKVLGDFLRRYNDFSVHQEIEPALADHDAVLLRKVTSKFEEYSEIRCYGLDYMLVDYNPIRQVYDCIEPLEPSVTAFSKKDIRDGKLEIRKFMYRR